MRLTVSVILCYVALGLPEKSLADSPGSITLHDFESSLPSIRRDLARVELVDSDRAGGTRALKISFEAVPEGRRAYPAVVFDGESLEAANFGDFDAIAFWVRNPGDREAAVAVSIRDGEGRRSFTRPARVFIEPGPWKRVTCQLVLHGLDRSRIASLHFFQESNREPCTLLVDDIDLLSPQAQRIVTREREINGHLDRARASAGSVGIESLIESDAARLEARLDEIKKDQELSASDRLVELSQLAQEASSLARTVFVRRQSLALNGRHVTDRWLADATKIDRFTNVNLASTSVTDDGLAHLSPEGLTGLSLGSPAITGLGLEHLAGAKLQGINFVGSSVNDAGMEAVAAFATLRSIDLSFSDVTNAGLRHLSELTRLQGLRLSGTAVNDAGLSHLRGLVELQRLFLDSTPVDGRGLAELASLRKLKTISLRDTPVTDAGLAGLGEFRELESLSLSDTSIMGTGLAGLKNAPKLHTLDLNGTRVNDAALVALGNLPALSRLMLSSTRITDASLARVSRGGRLIYLDIYGTNVTGEGIRQLAMHKGLSELYAGGTAADDDAIADLRGLGNLVRLDLNGTRVTDAALVPIGKMSKLSTLALAHNEIDGSKLAQLTALKRLRLLDLSGTGVSDDAAEHIAGLGELRTLILSDTAISNKGVDSILRLKKLSVLHLDGTRVDDRGLEQLTRLENLRELRLDGTAVSDAGIATLRSSNRVRSLTTLGLAETRVSDAGLADLPDSIRTLDLRRTSVTDVGVRRLRGKEGLQRLNLAETAVTDRSVEAIARLPNLRELDLGATSISDRGIPLLRSLRALQVLRLDRTGLTDFSAEALTEFSELREVSLEGTRITADGKAHLRRKHPELLVSLDHPWASGDSSGRGTWSTYTLSPGSDIEGLRSLPDLRSLSLRGRNLDGATLSFLRDFPRLEELDLRDTDLDDELATGFIGLQRLRVLRLSGSRVTDSALVHLEGMQTLEELELDDLQLTGSGLQYLAGLERLRSISLRETRLSDAEAARLAAIASLRRLVLSGTRIGDDALIAIARLPRLRFLDLYGTRVTDTGLARLSGVSSLTHLYVDATSITDRGLRSIGELPDLVELGAGRIRLTDRGLEHLVGPRHLGRLRVSHTGVTSRGLRTVAMIPTLRRLELDGCAIGDEAVEHLLDCTSLKELILDETELSDRGLEALLALPALERISINRTAVTAGAAAGAGARYGDVVIDHGRTRPSYSFGGIALSVLYGLIALTICVYGFHRYMLVGIFARRRGFRRVVEPVARFGDLPRVTIQLPLFNERNVASRIIEASCAIDYPGDRLQIQVLDDSTDASAEIARECCERFRKSGVDIEYLHRDSREGFKAGALAEGLKTASGEFIALFDADFVPPRDFLRRTIHHFTDEAVGVVQARWTHLNRDQSLLTRCQAMFLDGHFVVEQEARARSGRWFNFNGTAGLWRRECIDRSGGWEHDTLTEDTDLSYRAQLDDWTFVYLPHVEAAAELPSTMSAFLGQQHRWTKGLLQNAIKLMPRILRSRAPARVKLEAWFHLTAPIVYSAMFVLTAIAAPAAFISMPLADLRGAEAWLIGGLVLLMGTLAAAIFTTASQHALGRSVWRTIAHLPALMALGVGMSVVNTRAALGALTGVRSPFVRTPKFGGRSDFHAAPASERRTVEGLSPGLVELCVAGLLLASLVTSLQAPFALIGAPFLLLFASGYLWVGATRFFEAAPRPEPSLGSAAHVGGRMLRWSYASAAVALAAALVLLFATQEQAPESPPPDITVGVDMTRVDWKSRGSSVERVEAAREGLLLGVALVPDSSEEAEDGDVEGEIFIDLEGSLESLGSALATARQAVFDVSVPHGFSGELQAFASDADGNNQYGSIAFVERHDSRRRVDVSIAPSFLTPAMGYTDRGFDPEGAMGRVGLKVSAQSDRVRGRGFRPFRGDLSIASVRFVERGEEQEPNVRTIAAADRYGATPGTPEEFLAWSGTDLPWPFGYAFSGPMTDDRRAALERAYSSMKSHRLGFTRVYVGDYRTGLIYDENGSVTGIEDVFVDYLDGLAEIANRHGITVMFSLMDNTVLDGKGTEHRELIVDPVESSRFIVNAVVPIVRRLKRREVVWDLFNEPENVSGAPLSIVQDFVDRAIEQLREAVPSAKLTVVSRSLDELVYWRGRGLDVLSHNVFNLAVLASAMEGLGALELDAPVMIAEMDPELATSAALEALRHAGYRGVGLWGWGTDDKYDWDEDDLDRVASSLTKLLTLPEAP